MAVKLRAVAVSLLVGLGSLVIRLVDQALG
jgi:hypothetical protein